jgi:hypothetical protein
MPNLPMKPLTLPAPTDERTAALIAEWFNSDPPKSSPEGAATALAIRYVGGAVTIELEFVGRRTEWAKWAKRQLHKQFAQMVEDGVIIPNGEYRPHRFTGEPEPVYIPNPKFVKATGAALVTLTPAASVPAHIDAAVDQWVMDAWEVARRCDLETELYLDLRAGLPRLTARAIEEANDYPEADRALRRVFFDMPGRPISEALLQIWAYGKRVTSPDYKQQKRRGRPKHRSLARDFALCLVICLVCRTFGVRPTRSQTDGRHRRSGRTRSGISIVLDAVKRTQTSLERRLGYNLNEATFQAEQWSKLPGDLARGILGIEIT